MVSTVRSNPDDLSFLQRFLNVLERLGNKLPDPALLFVLALLVVWGISVILADVTFTELDPRNGLPIQVKNQLTEQALVQFTSHLVKNFIEFPPLGLVLVALLGVGVAEHSGFVAATLRGLLSLTPPALLSPMVLFVAILSHTAGDSGYVLVVPLAALMYAAVGRHPLLGITTAFAGVAGGFSASFLPASIDPLLQGFTQQAVSLVDSTRQVNPLCNWGFMSASCLVIVLAGWYVSDRIVEPRLQRLAVDGDQQPESIAGRLSHRERRGLLVAYLVLAVCLVILVQRVLTPELIWPPESADTNITVATGIDVIETATELNLSDSGQGMRDKLAYLFPAKSAWHSANGDIVSADAPLMKSIVPLIFLIFLIPGVVYGYVAGTFKSHRDVVQGMTKAMGTITYYMVMAFFAAQFSAAFRDSNLGVLLAIKGANLLKSLNLEPRFTIVGIILLTGLVNLVIGSASAKWALLGPVFVPMLMASGISPELTQCAYRIGDSSLNVVTPLMPYFPLVVVFCQRHVKNAGIGTLVSLMFPYSMTFLICWTVLLMLFWQFQLPLGINAPYTYP